MSFDHYIGAFADYLRSGDTSAMGYFCENPEDTKRLAVYRNGFYKGCIDALGANFPVCQKVMGSENFKKIARIYVDHFPPEQGTLVGYGKSFPDFITDLLRDHKVLVKLQLNLPDIARLDYAWLTSLMSAHSERTLTVESVTRLMEQGSDITNVWVMLNPSVLLLSVRSGVLSEWISLKINTNDVAQKAESSEADIVMLWRVQGAVQARSLSIGEAALIKSLQGKGNPLGDAFDAALSVDEHFDVSDVFSACLQNELLDIESI